MKNLTLVVIAGDLIERRDAVLQEIDACERLGFFDRAAQMEKVLENVEEQIEFRKAMFGMNC